jgi:hypothetical protein
VWSPKLATRSSRPSARCTGNGVDGGDLAALDLGYLARRDPYGLGELGLGEATALALLSEPVLSAAP